VFTDCDTGIDAIVLEGKDSGIVSAEYASMDAEYPHLNWNWTELLQDIHDYCQLHGIIINETAIIPSISNFTNVTGLTL